MAKKRTITLVDYRSHGASGSRPFLVEKMTNTVEFRTGEWLKETRVKDLCDITDYEVTIRNPKPSEK